MFDHFTAGQDVERDIEDVVGLVIREVPFEQLEIPVDVVDQPGAARHKEHGANATGAKALNPFGQLIVNVRGGHHGLVAFRPRAIFDPVEDSSLSLPENGPIAFL
jgi:hypothetical protein